MGPRRSAQKIGSPLVSILGATSRTCRGHDSLERLTKDPESFGPADVDVDVDVDNARKAGVPDEAIIDALHVGFLFNTVNRMANAFDWTWDSEEHVRVAAKVIHQIGYRLPGFALR